MTGRYDAPTGPDGGTANPHGQTGAPGIRIVRAAFVLAVVIVLGIVLLPSATRGPRLPTASPATHRSRPATTTTTTQPTTTTTLPSVPHSAIKVLVANGTTTPSGAKDVRAWLQNHGFDVAPFPPYDTTTLQSSDAVYVVGKGTRTMAVEVAAAVALGPSVIAGTGVSPPVPTSAGADVVVVLGADLASRANAGTLGEPPEPSSTTTTS